MDLTSFMKKVIYKVFVIVTIAMMVFTTLGIQPASASTLVPLLHPVVQLNAVNDSNGNFESLIGDNDESFDVSHIDNKTFVAAMKFNSIDTTKSIISANLILYVLNDNDNIAGLPTADLVTRVGSSNWINGSFPNELTGLSSEKVSISRSMTGEPVKVSIDVKQLLESPSAIDEQQITFLLSSDSQNMYIVKSGNTITRDWDPYLQITYGDAQNNAPTLISTAPANNAQDVSVNSPLSLTFSENVNAVEGKNIRIYDAENDNLIDSIAATNTNVVTVNSSTVSIQLTNNLLKGKTYYVLMDRGAFENTEHQGVAGITAKDIWRFTTLSPSNNANLSDLVLSPGTLIPNFKDSIVNYQVNVAHDVESIDVTPTAADSSATLTLNGALITNGQLTTIPLNKGNNTITIVVTAENGVTKTYTLTVKRALPTLQQVGNVDLSTSGDATWTDITGESSYAVQLFKDGSPIGSVVDKAADSTTHNFLPAMRAAGAGAYTVTVSAKGDGFTYLDGAPSIPSNKQTMIKLASITNSLSWDGNIAKWPAIPNAVSYDVLLYKGGTVIGTAANVLAGNINEGVDFTTAFQTNGIGSYTFTVQPKGNELLILDGDQGVSSSAKIISPLTYTVLYNGNGSTSGIVPQDNATYSQNDNVIVAANEGHLVKTGHSFIGWNTKADGTGTSYLPNATFKIVSENITLFAQWVINHYTVSFDVAGGSAVSNQTVNHGEKASQPTTEPTKAGYTFGGWYTDVMLTDTYDFNTVITANTTIYAKWEPLEYTVSFEVSGGSTVPSQSVENGKKASEPTPEPTKAGYTFAGWYTSSTGNTPFIFDNAIIEDTIVYAKWNPVTYTVSFDVDGGSAVPSQTIAHGEKATEPMLAPIKAGYTFGGWYTDKNHTQAFTFNSIITGDTTIYAKWEPLKYTVSFEVGDGSAVPNQSVAHGEKANEPTPVPTKTGYTFGGWYKDAGHTQAYDFNSVITETMTIYAKWNAQTYTVGFNMDGGSAVPSQSVVHGEKASEPTPEPTKVGYTFGGWYKDAGHTQAYDFNSVITETMTIYAKWNAQTYTVSFNTDGGSMVSSQSVAHGGKVSKPTSAPTKAGYTFGGWYTSSTLEKLFDFDSSSITRNITIYAKWVSIVSPPTSNDSSNSESSTPSTNTEHIVVDVEGEDGVNLTKTPIIRTTMPDGVIKDHVSMSEAIAKETIEKAKQLGNDTARIIIPDANDKVSEVVIDIPKSSLAQIHAGNIQLEIATMNAVISIPNVSMSNFSNDLYFRLVPIKSLEQQHQVEERILKEELIKDTLQSEKVNLIGRPMTIETNMQNRPVTLTLPLPKNITQEQLDNLAIFIEHSDGTKELIRGKVVDYQKDMLGLQFEVQKFSTFAILYLPEDENVEEPTTDHITHTPYIQGYADGTFRPNSSVTRAQMASMFARQLTGNAIPMSKATFTDTVQHDAKDAIEFVKEAGLFNGVTETSFHPNGFITRAQMAAIAARWMEKQCADSPNADFCKPTSLDKILKDVSNNHWAVQAINTVNGLGIMTGITADTFNPDGYLTRAQAVKVLNRLFERQVTTEHQNPIFKDVPRKHWAFYEIQEAAKK